MLQTTLLNVKEKLISYHLFNEDTAKLDRFINLLKLYNSGEVILPRVFKIELKISIEEVYKVLTELVKLNILEINYKIACSHPSDHPIQETYRTIGDIPTESCNMCEEECILLKNVTIVFRVIY